MIILRFVFLAIANSIGWSCAPTAAMDISTHQKIHTQNQTARAAAVLVIVNKRGRTILNLKSDKSKMSEIARIEIRTP